MNIVNENKDLGYPFWVSDNKKKAIWFATGSMQWFLGNKHDVGKGRGYLKGPKAVHDWPNQISSNEWTYAHAGDDKWYQAGRNDISIRDMFPNLKGRFSKNIKSLLVI